MAVLEINALKTLFASGEFPTGQDFTDLLDTMEAMGNSGLIVAEEFNPSTGQDSQGNDIPPANAGNLGLKLRVSQSGNYDFGQGLVELIVDDIIAVQQIGQSYQWRKLPLQNPNVPINVRSLVAEYGNRTQVATATDDNQYLAISWDTNNLMGTGQPFMVMNVDELTIGTIDEFTMNFSQGFWSLDKQGATLAWADNTSGFNINNTSGNLAANFQDGALLYSGYDNQLSFDSNNRELYSFNGSNAFPVLRFQNDSCGFLNESGQLGFVFETTTGNVSLLKGLTIQQTVGDSSTALYLNKPAAATLSTLGDSTRYCVLLRDGDTNEVLQLTIAEFNTYLNTL